MWIMSRDAGTPLAMRSDMAKNLATKVLGCSILALSMAPLRYVLTSGRPDPPAPGHPPYTALSRPGSPTTMRVAAQPSTTDRPACAAKPPASLPPASRSCAALCFVLNSSCVDRKETNWTMTPVAQPMATERMSLTLKSSAVITSLRMPALNFGSMLFRVLCAPLLRLPNARSRLKSLCAPSSAPLHELRFRILLRPRSSPDSLTPFPCSLLEDLARALDFLASLLASNCSHSFFVNV
mmetsp:Transcript_17389/g.47993  ORF Transcript_17389/g.47993 Transcript_17389/m.47993 type:complete len:238 (+) Transcript_17389:359-1072(+)